jgi:putative protease
MAEQRIGQVTHFYNRISVAVLILSDIIRLGDTIHIVGRSTDFQQEITSLQINHRAVPEAWPGQEIALKVDERVRRGDTVFKVLDT